MVLDNRSRLKNVYKRANGKFQTQEHRSARNNRASRVLTFYKNCGRTFVYTLRIPTIIYLFVKPATFKRL